VPTLPPFVVGTFIRLSPAERFAERLLQERAFIVGGFMTKTFEQISKEYSQAKIDKFVKKISFEEFKKIEDEFNEAYKNKVYDQMQIKEKRK
jgi:hypothetical protein